jgi:hypothetical protein
VKKDEPSSIGVGNLIPKLKVPVAGAIAAERRDILRRKGRCLYTNDLATMGLIEAPPEHRQVYGYIGTAELDALITY